MLMMHRPCKLVESTMTQKTKCHMPVIYTVLETFFLSLFSLLCNCYFRVSLFFGIAIVMRIRQSELFEINVGHQHFGFILKGKINSFLVSTVLVIIILLCRALRKLEEMFKGMAGNLK